MPASTPTHAEVTAKARAEVARLAKRRDELTAELSTVAGELEEAIVAATHAPARLTHAEVARAAGIHRSRVSQIVGEARRR